MRRILITGASDGLGAALVRLYLQQGWEVEALCRDGGSAGRMRQALAGSAGAVRTTCCDLGDPKAVDAAARDLRMKEFDLCIFAAGMLETGYADELDPAAYRRSLEVNFLAPATLAAALAKTSCKRFVFILSGAADFLVPGLSPYAFSKRMLRDYLEIVRMERSFADCQVLAVWPGPIATRINEKARLHGRFRPSPVKNARSPEEVAERIFRAQQAGRRTLVVSSLPILLGRLQALAPRLVGAIVNAHPALRGKARDR